MPAVIAGARCPYAQNYPERPVRPLVPFAPGARCLETADGNDLEHALARYEAHRKPRTWRIQAISSANTWMQKGEQDTSWLYG